VNLSENDSRIAKLRGIKIVIPAKAGIQAHPHDASGEVWIPAFAGMTKKK